MLKKLAALKYYFLAFIIVESLCLGILHLYFHRAETDYLSGKAEQLESEYRSVFNAYSMLSRAVFSDFINTPEVARILSEAVRSDAARRNELRNTLYKRTLPYYQRLTDRHLKILQFHLPDGTSFLRVHKPESYGDNLFAARPLIKAVNTRRAYLEGFEMGKMLSGFRFVFPVFYHDRHVGSVETGIAFKGIKAELELLQPSEYHFILKQNIIDERVWNKSKVNFNLSELNGDYLYEKFEMTSARQGREEAREPDLVQRIGQQEKRELVERMRADRQFAVYAVVNGDYYVAAFLPLRNTEGRAEGYIVSVAKDGTIQKYTRDRYLLGLLMTALALLSLAYLRTLNRHRLMLLEQNYLFATTINSLPYPFYVINADDYIIQIANTAACDRSLTGKITCHKLTHRENNPCSQAEHPCPLAMVRITGKPVTVEHEHFDSEGALRKVEVHGYPIFDQNNRLAKFIEYSVDITERKRLEADLLTAQKLETVGILAGGIAHDFNNTLNIIHGNVSLAKMLGVSGRVAEALTDAEIACETAKELATRLITFSRGGNPMLERYPVSEAVRDALTMAPKVNGINYIHSPVIEGVVEADRRQLRQVLLNLFINAAEAMPKDGAVRITAKIMTLTQNETASLSAGSYVCVSVADEGIGIPGEHLPKIFDPYFSTKERYSDRGMGLGLAVCWSIIRKHGGAITVESTVGAGTVFHVYLRAAK